MLTSLSWMNDENFATIEDPKRLAQAMQQKIRAWRDYCFSIGLMSFWQRKITNYYGRSEGGNSSQAIVAGGSEGELALMKINDLHRLVQEQLVIVTSNRPAGQAKAINSNPQSLRSAALGSALAEYYMSQVGFETQFVRCAEIALLLDESFIELFWDKAAGDPIAIDPQTGTPEMSGDLVIRTHCSWNVARDFGLKTDLQNWHIVSFPGNKFDSAAKYPDFSQYIIGCKDDNLPDIPMNKIPDDSDAIWHHLLIHDRTPGTPKGRYALLIGDEIVLDTKNGLPYKPYPIERMTPSDVIDGPTGYCPANDIMGPEQLTDGLHSIVATNEITFGGQNLVGPEGANLKISDIAKGVRYFEMKPDLIDKLRPLELCHTPPEVFTYITMLTKMKEAAVGSVQTSLAQQASQGASGSSMALIQTQAISFNSGTQRSYYRVLSSTMTKVIEILRTYADTPRIAKIVGKTKSAALKEFKYTGEDLNSISSIVYELINPAAQTFGGRIELGKMLIQANQIKSPKQLINVVYTGQLDVLTQDDEADGMLILDENEALMDGRPVEAVITDIHVDHIKSHNSLLTQAAREKDPDLIQRVLAHNQKHINLWQQATVQNPAILIATGQQPLPMPPPGVMALPAPGAGPPPQGGPPRPPGPPIGKAIGSGQSPAIAQAGEVKEPNLPNIAGSKEKPVVPGVTGTA